MEMIKQNTEPIEIEYVEDEHDSEKDFKPSFWWWNQRYYLEDFTRVHNNPWFGSGNEFPAYIHGILTDGSHASYTDPFFIELIGDTEVNIYKEV